MATERGRGSTSQHEQLISVSTRGHNGRHTIPRSASAAVLQHPPRHPQKVTTVTRQRQRPRRPTHRGSGQQHADIAGDKLPIRWHYVSDASSTSATRRPAGIHFESNDNGVPQEAARGSRCWRYGIQHLDQDGPASRLEDRLGHGHSRSTEPLPAAACAVAGASRCRIHRVRPARQ